MPSNNRTAHWTDAPIAVYTDPIFFSKYNIHLGTRLIYFGRTASGCVLLLTRYGRSDRALTGVCAAT
jgi:hypothetical protein